MVNYSNHKSNLSADGFTIIDGVYSADDIRQIIHTIDNTDKSKSNFRKATELFAIRQFLHEIPAIIKLIFTENLQSIIQNIFGTDYFVVKSIYFDKPITSNWYVSYHQDLTISVNKKLNIENFGPWTVKQNQFAVQPPLHILQNNYTIRIHLDPANEDNGALKIIPGSHLNGITRPENIDWQQATEKTCTVSGGGIMIMKPLLLHSSGRTTNGQKRRVIHIEFSNQPLPLDLKWSEQWPGQALLF